MSAASIVPGNSAENIIVKKPRTTVWLASRRSPPSSDMAFVTAARIPARFAAAIMMIHSFAADSVTDAFRKQVDFAAANSIQFGTQEANPKAVFTVRLSQTHWNVRVNVRI
jgi:hypothetical protein